jgi:hypothetical protein
MQSSHTRIGSRPLALRTFLASLLFLVLSLTVFSIPAQAIPFTLNYTGTLNLVAGVDDFGIDGIHFHWTGTFDSSAVRVGGNGGSATLSYFQSTIPITLELTQQAGGIFTGGTALISPSVSRITERANQDGYCLTFACADFGFKVGEVPDPQFPGELFDVELIPGEILVANGFTGPSNPNNVLTPFGTSDVIEFGRWELRSGNPFDPFGGGLYEVADGNVFTSSVPEPSTALLLGLGLTGLAAKGRRRNRS